MAETEVPCAELRPRVHADPLGELAHHTIRPLVAIAFGVAVHVERLSPRVRLVKEVKVVLVDGRVVVEVAVGES